MTKKGILIFICGGVLVLLVLLVGIRMLRQPAPPEIAEVPVPSSHDVAPAVRQPVLDGGMLESVPDADVLDSYHEAQVIEQRMQSLIDAAEPTVYEESDEGTDQAAVTPEEGLRRMADSTGMPLDANAVRSYSREEFLRDAAPHQAPAP